MLAPLITDVECKPMVNLEQLHQQEHVLTELSKDIYIWAWVLMTFLTAGIMSTLKWLNTPMPNRTWGRGLLAFMNGMAVALLVALFLGDQVIRNQISLFQFTFFVVISAFGGSQILDLLADFVLGLGNRILHKFISDENFPENHTEK